MNKQITLDSLTSLMEGMNLPAFYMGVQSTLMEADAAFIESTWYGKILSIPVDDSVREWRSWKADANQIEKLEAEEARLDYRQVVREARMIARHQGGGVILPIGLPGNPASPLNLNSIVRGQIKKLVNLSREDITPGQLVRNPLDEYYNQPEYWTVGDMRIHPSRIILCNGKAPPGSVRRRGEIWGVPIWSWLRKATMSADEAATIVSALLKEAKLDIVSIPELAELLSTPEGEAALKRRWEVAARLKDLNNIILIDGGPGVEGTKKEEWDQKQITWGGMAESVNLLLKILAGAADIPITRLTGEQQSGLSGSDVGSLRNYYDSVGSGQKLELTPQIRPLDEMLIRSALGRRPPEVWYVWNSLYQMDEKTAAEVDKLQAETSAIYASNMLLPTEALEIATQNRMIETGRWPGLEKAIEEAPEEPDTENRPVVAPANQLGDAAPRTLYVSRKVVNAKEIIDWAKSVGFETTLPADDLHVTIVFSREPVDWMKVGNAWQSRLELPEGGPRIMEQFGEAKVLTFASDELQWRHMMAKEVGASWDHPEYQPHITISYGPMPEGVEAYQGKIILGPEIFKEVVEDWGKNIKEQ